MYTQLNDPNRNQWVLEWLAHCNQGEETWKRKGIHNRYALVDHCPTCAGSQVRVYKSEEVAKHHLLYFTLYGVEYEWAMH